MNEQSTWSQRDLTPTDQGVAPRHTPKRTRWLLVAAVAALAIGGTLFTVFNVWANRLENDLAASAGDVQTKVGRSVYAAEPDEYTLGSSSCSVVDGLPTFKGSVLNRSSKSRQFLVTVAFTDGTGTDLGKAVELLPPVEAGSRLAFSAVAKHPAQTPPSDITCEPTIPTPDA